MRFTTFRNLILGGAVSGLFGSVYYCGKSPSPPIDKAAVETRAQDAPKAADKPAPKPDDKPLAQAEDKVPAPSVEAKSGSEKQTAKGHPLLAMRPFDDEIIRLLQQTPSGDKAKDATPNRPYKVNLYAEGGKYVRAKVDLNRNGKWDEKWSIEEKNGETVLKRQVSPNDDDTSYPDKFKLRNKQWEKTEP